MRILNFVLLPLSLLYGTAVALRNALFERGILRTEKISVPVISVGNLSAGGSGKTPLVELIARTLRAAGHRVAIVSRGYGRTTRGYVVVSNGRQRCAEASESGDEPSQLADKLDGVVVVVDEQRVRGARKAVSDFGSDVVLLDDGFQHRYLQRDLDIVVMPAEGLLAPHRLLPAGRGREPMRSLKRAQLVVLNRVTSQESFRVAAERLRRWFQGPIVGAATRPVAFRNATTAADSGLSSLHGARVVAFSGIGAPGAFEETLQSLGAVVVHHRKFKDHHRYSREELSTLVQHAESSGVRWLVTTEKDVARIRGGRESLMDLFSNFPLHSVEIEMAITEGRVEFERLVKQAASGGR